MSEKYNWGYKQETFFYFYFSVSLRDLSVAGPLDLWFQEYDRSRVHRHTDTDSVNREDPESGCQEK